MHVRVVAGANNCPSALSMRCSAAIRRSFLEDAMNANDFPNLRRRQLLTALVAAGIAAGWPRMARSADPANAAMKIGIIGSGRIGGTLGELWAKAGYPVMFSSLDLAHDRELAARVGAGASAGTAVEAAAYGDVVLISVPYSAIPQISRDIAGSIKGKVILDTSNPIPSRDGDMANAARDKGAGLASAEYFPSARVVRAFNSVGFNSLRSEAHRAGDKVAIPLAGDDAAALDVAKRLVAAAGFEPVVVGGLAKAKSFDPGTPAFGKALTAAELRKTLGMGS
jgi:predicted dinucleotide-binding enzyme